jgi:hypothetical protein
MELPDGELPKWVYIIIGMVCITGYILVILFILLFVMKASTGPM